jgi:hypothetical protein
MERSLNKFAAGEEVEWDSSNKRDTRNFYRSILKPSLVDREGRGIRL